jgi:hypothetical protein
MGGVPDRYTHRDVDTDTGNAPVTSLRLAACASTVAFAALAAVLAAIGAIPRIDAILATTSVALVFVPTGWWAGAAVRRRLAEVALLPAAFALTMIGSTAMRRMVLPPLLLLAIWAAAASAWDRVPERRRPALAVVLGLAARAAVGLGSSGFGSLSVALAVAVAAILPWMAYRGWGRRAAELGALLGAVLPWQRWPLTAVLLTVVCLVLGFVLRRGDRDEVALGWIPGIGAGALFAAASASWPGLKFSIVFPEHGWPAWVALFFALAVTARLPPGVAGAVWLAATLCLGPVTLPSPEQRAFELSSQLGELEMSAGTGGNYVVDLDVENRDALADGTPLAVLRFGGDDHVIFAGGPDQEAVWRPHGLGAGTRWRASARSHFMVAKGERPVLVRHPDLSDQVTLRVETIGAVRATPPRDWSLPRWLLATAAVVAVIELASGTWRSGIGVLPWLVLVIGSMVARAPVEPLRLVGERLAVDIALAALLAAWLPAAASWLRRRRVFITIAALLLPLALATPHLTPPLYGDEPFHLVVMDSLAGDGDLDITDDLDLERYPQNELYARGEPLFHSPVLGVLLLPGYMVAGRAGALVLLALMGAALAALIARRARDFELRETTIGLLVMVLGMTYPLATFATQIWPELPGALAVAALLVLAARTRGGRWRALALAITATAIKTRLGLLTLPIAAAVWLKRRPLRGLLMLVLAAAVALAVGWLTMGHPFGPYRRLHHLVPSDLGLAARVVAGLVFDAAAGLAFTAPVWLAALAGIAMLWRRGGSGERMMVVGAGLTVIALLHSSEWYGGGAPPARYLVPVLPAFALAGGLVAASPSRGRRLLPLLLPPSLVAWWVLMTRPHFSVNPGDGGYWLADALSRRFAADGRFFFPSYLVMDSAAVVVPIVIVVLAVLALWLAKTRAGAAAHLGRGFVALWLAAAAALVLILDLRPDRVVEAEAPQIRRSGGKPVPPAGTVARFSHRRGWRLDHGNRVTVPLNLREGDGVVVEGWLLGTARRAATLELSWDGQDPVSVTWSGDGVTERLGVPPAPGSGRHRLSITLRSRPHGAIVLDRFVIKETKGQ